MRAVSGLEIFNGWGYAGGHPFGRAVGTTLSHRSGRVDLKVGGELLVAVTAACDVYDAATEPSGPRRRTMGIGDLADEDLAGGCCKKGVLSTMDEASSESRAQISPDEREVLLVGILDGPTAREDEKLEAAMGLEDFGGPVVETCPIRIIRAEDFTSMLAQVCAESLGGSGPGPPVWPPPSWHS